MCLIISTAKVGDNAHSKLQWSTNVFFLVIVPRGQDPHSY